MQQSNGKNTRSAQVLHSQLPPKATNAYGGRIEEEQRRTQQMELQDQDLLGSPHLEEEWIGGNVDLDLLSISLKDMQESWEGMRGRQAFSKGQQWRREGRKTCSKGWGTVGEETPLNRFPQKVAVGLCREAGLGAGQAGQTGFSPFC